MVILRRISNAYSNTQSIEYKQNVAQLFPLFKLSQADPSDRAV
jgi:hypothetical protein